MSDPFQGGFEFEPPESLDFGGMQSSDIGSDPLEEDWMRDIFSATSDVLGSVNPNANIVSNFFNFSRMALRGEIRNWNSDDDNS